MQMQSWLFQPYGTTPFPTSNQITEILKRQAYA